MNQDKSNKVREVIEKDIWESIKEFLDLGLHIGEGDTSINVTVGLLVMLSIAFVLTGLALKWLGIFFTRKMNQDDKLKFISVFQFIKYTVYVIVVLITISASGIDITILITASAALFVGLGLALRELFQDVIGGIFIIVDKSLSVGDIIEVNGKIGKVIEIKLRTVRAITREDKVLIIPNHKFISDIIYNYTQNHKTTREKVNVGVAYGSDVQLVTKVLEEVVSNQKGVLKNPKPFVLFEDFGDSALLFSLNFFVTDSFFNPMIKSELRYKIDAKFRELDITIPFPQRDIHVFQQSKNN
ncbi:MAG: mechanosensitive ion channel [Maribacter sp.]|nr:mechanosensitive ion channel [Maribacter sp.]